MTNDRSFFTPGPALLLSFFMLAACQPAPEQGSTQEQEAVAAAAGAVDEYQIMALNAGKNLIGTRAPNLSFTTLDGRSVNLGGARERPLYLKFWATWCVTCREQMDSFNADFARHGGEVDVVAVNTGVNDDLEAVQAYRREVQLAMPIAIDDGRLAEALHLKVTPQHVIIGRDGIIRYVGHLDDDRLRQELRAAIADAPLGVADSVRAEAGRRQGDRAAAVSRALTSVQGGQVRIDGPAQGAPRLIYFLSPWCETYLKDSRPAMARECKDTREALMRLTAAGEAEVVGIASGLSTDADGVRRYLSRTGFQAPVVIDDDGRLFRRFGIRSFPAVIRLDAGGRPTGRLAVGEIDALARKPVS